jgi:glycosyltransferase involved in cell wall biosynthesis
VRLGIDAAWADRGPVSGRRVVTGLIQGLHDLDSSHTVVLFTSSSTTGQRWPQFEHVSCRRLPSSLVTNVVTMAKAAEHAGVDAMLFQQFPPLRARYARCAFVHDAIVFERPDFFPLVQRLYFRPQRVLLPRADWIVTSSEAELRRLERLGLATPGRSGTVGYGLDPAFFEAADPDRVATVRRRYALPDRFVLYVGRLNRRKNVVNLVRGYLRSEARQRGYRLVLVGEREDEEPSLDAALEQAGDLVVELGRVPDDDLHVLYRIADAFAYVSFAEGFGLPMLEALAASTAVVVSDIPPAREVCCAHAVFVDPMSPEDIGTGIDTALDRSGIELDEARAHARTFTWRRAAERVVENLEQALAATELRSATGSRTGAATER